MFRIVRGPDHTTRSHSNPSVRETLKPRDAGVYSQQALVAAEITLNANSCLLLPRKAQKQFIA